MTTRRNGRRLGAWVLGGLLCLGAAGCKKKHLPEGYLDYLRAEADHTCACTKEPVDRVRACLDGFGRKPPKLPDGYAVDVAQEEIDEELALVQKGSLCARMNGEALDRLASQRKPR